MGNIDIQPLGADDRPWVARFIAEHWGSELVVAHGQVYYPHHLPGFVAMGDGERVGLVTYSLVGEECEIVTLDSTRSNLGIGTALIEAVKTTACQAGCKRLWLITTNDNLNALRFYQRRGFVIAAVHPNAIEAARRLKPIPRIGEFGIPIRDEIVLEMTL